MDRLAVLAKITNHRGLTGGKPVPGKIKTQYIADLHEAPLGELPEQARMIVVAVHDKRIRDCIRLAPVLDGDAMGAGLHMTGQVRDPGQFPDKINAVETAKSPELGGGVRTLAVGR